MTTPHAAAATMPDGCVVRLPAGQVERFDRNGTVLVFCEHRERWALRLSGPDDGQPVAAQVSDPGATNATRWEDTVPWAPAKVEPIEPFALRRHDVVSWQDRLGIERVGRVKTVTPAGDLEVVTGTGASARIHAAFVDGFKRDQEPEPETAESAKAKAQTAYEQRLGIRVRGAITDIYEALRELDPDGDPDGLKIRACHEAEAECRRARSQMQAMIDQAEAVAPRTEEV